MASYLVTYFCFCRSYRLKKIQERRFCQFLRWNRQPCFWPRSEVFVVGTEFPYMRNVTVPQVDCCTSCSLAASQSGISQRRLIGEEGKETTGESWSVLAMENSQCSEERGRKPTSFQGRKVRGTRLVANLSHSHNVHHPLRLP